MFQIITALIIFLFPLAYSPGPGNMFFAANGARFGFRSTIPANIGYHVATWIVTLAIGLGFARAVDSQPQVFGALKIAGSVYVLWLAWKMFRSGALAGDRVAKPASFIDGVVLLILNPKAYVIIALMFTQFLAPGDPRGFVVVIATVFTINNLIAFIVWITIGDQIAARFRTPDTARKLNMMFGVILAGVAIWMLLS
ncbi:lysine transporter LysE [Amylibacter ulvae]|uniref:Lysine transporter LysE n=1 Tax=Paramylibacter ulvae TaxID=1651968 RepID=A0ABQ3CYS2_9RHOB|nr:LysE family translocator [Amylibacter ulvae]GHA47847.1 lysine transporter LysE [Amylibacter ulvae]